MTETDIVKKHYRILSIPVAKYVRCGDIEKLTVLGITAYDRIGYVERYAGLIVRAGKQDAT